jgi:histidinol-phosphate aminotransferase
MHIRAPLKSLSPYRPGMSLHDLRRFGVSSCVKLASNENPLPPSQKVLKAMEEAVAGVRLYPEGGAPRLRTALAEHYGRPVEEVITGAGIDDLLDLTLRSMLEPGDNLVMAHPGFVRYAIAAMGIGAEVRRLPGPADDPYAHDLDGMVDAVDERTRMVVLVNPNNPTGTRFTRDDLERYLARAPRDVLTILDEAYFEFVDEPDHPNGLDYLDGDVPLLVFRTFSKIHSLAGVRVGFGFGPPELINHLDRVRPPFNVTSVAQAAALAALGDEEHLRASRDLARSETAFLTEELSRRGWIMGKTWTNFVFGRAPLRGDPLTEGLMRRGFIVRPLTGWGLEDCFFRLSHGTREQNLAFLAALDEVTREAAPA